jgi:hypothetical protein
MMPNIGVMYLKYKLKLFFLDSKYLHFFEYKNLVLKFSTSIDAFGFVSFK